jgi:hypothetical protein
MHTRDAFDFNLLSVIFTPAHQVIVPDIETIPQESRSESAPNTTPNTAVAKTEQRKPLAWL